MPDDGHCVWAHNIWGVYLVNEETARANMSRMAHSKSWNEILQFLYKDKCLFVLFHKFFFVFLVFIFSAEPTLFYMLCKIYVTNLGWMA